MVFCSHCQKNENADLKLCMVGSVLVQWEIVLLMQYCDRVDQSMKLSTVFVEGMYSNIRRGAIQIYIPLQKYVLQETLVNINRRYPQIFLIAPPNTIIIAKIKNGDITGS